MKISVDRKNWKKQDKNLSKKFENKWREYAELNKSLGSTFTPEALLMLGLDLSLKK